MTDTGPVTLLTPEQGLAEFEQNATRIMELLAGAELDAPVTGCPGWTLTDLVVHLGGVHQWARHAIVEGNPDGEQHAPDSTGRDPLIAWYQQAATSLADVLRATDPDAPAWNFGPKPRTARFWFRRQAHETGIHLWDARSSQSGDDNRRSLQSGPGHAIDPLVAADGIDEVVTMFFPRQVRLGRIPPLTASLRLDVDGSSWVLRGDGTEPFGHDHDGGVGGAADAVLLLLWGRITLDDDRLTLTGDRDSAEAVLAAGIVP